MYFFVIELGIVDKSLVLLLFLEIIYFEFKEVIFFILVYWFFEGRFYIED